MATNPMLIGAGTDQVINKILPEVLKNDIGIREGAAELIQEKVADKAKEEIPAENQPKAKLKSITIWAGILSLITGGMDFVSNITADDIVQAHKMILDVGAILGGLGAIYGRIRARRVVS